MKVILICPSERHEIEQLSGATPLAAVPFFGETVLGCWMDHLASIGVTHAKILAADRVPKIRDAVSEGEKWGLKVEVSVEGLEPSIAEARKRHKVDEGWMPEPNDVLMVDRLPWEGGVPMFESYGSFFAACKQMLDRIEPGFRVGMKQLQPGVWVGRGSVIAPSAKITGPCWIGRGVHVGPNAVIGAYSIIEDEVFVDETAEIEQAWIGPETFVGGLTRVHESLAWGATLINWRSGSHIQVPDPFLLSSIEQARTAVKSLLLPRRLPSLFQERVVRPVAALANLKAKLPG